MASLRQKQYSVLGMSTLSFAVNFAVWTMFSIIGIRIKDELGLSESQFGLMVALPILTGSLVRLPLGLITDRFGGRIVFFIHMLLVAIPIYGLAFASQYWHYLVLGLFVGLAGGSFAVGIAYTSAWFEKERQGTAMGIFGAGNAGAAITNLVAPMIVVAFGWRMVPQVYSVAMLVTAVLFWLFTWTDPAHLKGAAEASQRPTLAKQLAPLAELRVWRFGLYYFFVFGGFVALALWLPKYYIAEYGLDLKTASFITMLFTLPSGLIRALGGWFSDHYGARSVNWGVFWVCLVCLFFLSYPQTTMTIHGIQGDLSLGIGLNVWLFTFLVFVVGIAQGFGKASVYRIIHDYYPSNMGTVGGMVGVIGGLGGFCLPILFGYAADHIGRALLLLHVAVRPDRGLHGLDALRDQAATPHRRPGRLGRRRPSSHPSHPLLRNAVMGMIANTQLKAAQGPLLLDWRPEDPEFWARNGKRIASRNLWISIPALLLAFAVWMIWSTVTVRLNSAGFAFSNDQLFLLAALPSISGATLRVFYSFMVPIFGGRRWTALSTASMLIPCIWLGFAVQDPSTPYWVFALIALLCGFGGGNFASSMSNISFFYPKSQQGTALGLNAGLGNLGVSVMQFAVPLAVAGGLFGAFGGEPQQLGDGGRLWLQNAGWIWVPFIAVVSVAAWFGMNDIADAKASFRDQAVIFKRKHNWLMCWLYVATFGSFIGFSAGFAMLSKTQFPDVNPLQYAFLGPLVGALSRPLGGWLADKFGGARITLWNYALMIGGVFAVIAFLPGDGGQGNFFGFLGAFILLFFFAGIGNGSTFRMIPVIFRNEWARRVRDGQADEAGAARNASMESAAVIGFSAAIGAFGGFFIPKAFGTSLHMTGSAEGALYVFIAYYLSCIVATWWWYARKGAESPC